MFAVSGIRSDAPELLAVNGQISQFHVVSSRAVLGTGRPTEEQMARLREATGAVLQALEPGTAVFDTDVDGHFGSPILLFARDGLDLTEEVKLVYAHLTQGSVEMVNAPSAE